MYWSNKHKPGVISGWFCIYFNIRVLLLKISDSDCLTQGGEDRAPAVMCHLCCGSPCGWPLWFSCTKDRYAETGSQQSPWNKIPRAKGVRLVSNLNPHLLANFGFHGLVSSPCPLFYLMHLSAVSHFTQHRKWWQ